MKPYKWVVEIDVAPIWVADGFDLTNDRLRRMLARELPHARGDEIVGSVLASPDPQQIRCEQGHVAPGYSPRYHEEAEP